MHELSIYNGSILRGLRVVIPKSLPIHERILTEVRVYHVGAVCAKSIASLHAWWAIASLKIELRNGKTMYFMSGEPQERLNPPKSTVTSTGDCNTTMELTSP